MTCKFDSMEDSGIELVQDLNFADDVVEQDLQ